MWRFARCTRIQTLLIRWRSLSHNQSMRRTWDLWELDTYISNSSVRGRFLCHEYVYVMINNCYLFHGWLFFTLIIKYVTCSWNSLLTMIDSKLSLVYVVVWDNNDVETSTCINWWSCFTDHGYGDIRLMMWTCWWTWCWIDPLQDNVGIVILYVPSVFLECYTYWILRPEIAIVSHCV